jgi:hypothetical protein
MHLLTVSIMPVNIPKIYVHEFIWENEYLRECLHIYKNPRAIVHCSLEKLEMDEEGESEIRYGWTNDDDNCQL